MINKDEVRAEYKNSVTIYTPFLPIIDKEEEQNSDESYNEADYAELLEKYSLGENSKNQTDISFQDEGTIELGTKFDEKNNNDEDSAATVEIIQEHKKGLIPLDYKFNNLSNWKPSSLNPKVQLLKFKLMQEITYREHLLDQLGRVVKNIDIRYWKYCVMRIRTAEENKSLNSEQLVSQRNRIVVMQNEISALIAQVRSLSLNVIHSAKKLRYALRKDYQTEDDLSIYFKGENYLLKIKNDLKDIFVCDAQPLQYWIAFEPNTFMIPPMKPHYQQLGSDNDSNLLSFHSMALLNPLELWQREVLDGVFMQWFRSHCEKMAREMKVKKSLHNKKKIISISKKMITITGIDSHKADEKDPIKPVEHSDISRVDSNTDATSSINETSTVKDSGADQIVKDDGLQDIRPKESIISSDGESKLTPIENTTENITAVVISVDNPTELQAEGVRVPDEVISIITGEPEQPRVALEEGVQEDIHVSQERDDSDRENVTDNGVAVVDPNAFLPTSVEPEKGTYSSVSTSIAEITIIHDDSGNHVTNRDRTISDMLESMLPTIAEDISIDLLHKAPSSPLINLNTDSASLTENSFISAVPAAQVEEWQALREFASSSWGVDETTGVRGQGKKYAPMFWTNMDQNPFVVEAVVCFQEVFPRMAIVPTVPTELQNKCLAAERILLREVNDTERLKQRREDSISRKESFAEELSKLEDRMTSIVQSSSQCSSGLEEGAIAMKPYKEEFQRLQLRQQGDSSLLSGISREYLLSNASAAQLASSVLLPPIANGSQFLKSVDIENSNYSSQAFLTESFANLPRKESSLVSGDSFGTDAHYHEHFKQHLVDTSALTFFRIENAKASKVIEERVADDRRMIEFLKDNSGVGVIPIVRQCNKGRRQLNRLSEQFMRFVAVTVQRVVRGFLGRRRFLKKWNLKRAVSSAVKIQKVVRGIIHRKMAGVYERRRNIETFLLRKALVQRHRAALLLTNFIRIIINCKREKKNLPLMKLTPSYLDIQRRNKRKKLLMKTKRIGNLTRGSISASSGTISHYGDQVPHNVHDDISKIAKPPTLADEAVDMEDDRSVASALSLAAPSEKSTISMDSNQKFELAMEREVGNVLTIHDEVERRKWQKQRAINLVQKVNEGKVVKDTVYTSRLIPKKEIKSLTSVKKVKLFSVKEHSFLNRTTPHQFSASQSSILSTASSSLSQTSSGLIPLSFEVYTGGPNRLRISPKKSLTTSTSQSGFNEQKTRQLSISASSPTISQPNDVVEARRSAKISNILKEFKQSKSSSFSPRDYKSNDSSPKLLVEDNNNSLLLNSMTDFKSGTVLDDAPSFYGGSSTETSTGYLRKYFSRY